jgi:MFS family permease
VVGPLVGGTLVETVGWRWVFYLNVPVGLVTAALIARNLKETGYPRPGGSLDLLGGTWFSGAVLLLLVGLKLGGVTGAAVLAAAAGSFSLFVLRERRAEEPLFDLALFRIPVYRIANVVGFFAGAVLVGLTAYLPVYVMNARGGSPVASGLTLTPISIGWVTAATIGGRLLVRHGYRRIVIPGHFVLLAATFGISRVGLDTPWAIVAGLLLLTGIGFGLSMTTFLVAVQESVGAELRGQATSAVQFFRQIGGALGVAVLELVYLAQLPDPSLLEARPGQTFLPAERAQLMDGFDAAFLVATGIALLALLPTLLGTRVSTREPARASPP